MERVEDWRMQVKWTLDEADANGYHQNNYGITFVDPNGTVIATEYLSAFNGHHAYFTALNPDGSIKWRAVFNGYPWQLVKGANGEYYYVDFKNDTDFLNNSE